MQLCSAPLDFYEFERVARSQPQNFGAFFDDYAALHRLTASIVRQGAESGEFQAVSLTAAEVPPFLRRMETEEGYLRTSPQHGLEAFFGAILERR